MLPAILYCKCVVRVRDIMQKHFVGVSKTTTVASAVKLSSSAKVDLMPVLDGEKLCGVVISKDLKSHAESGGNVGQVMRNPVFVYAYSDLDSAFKVMIGHGIVRVPVVADKLTMMCVGILSSTDIVKFIKKH